MKKRNRLGSVNKCMNIIERNKIGLYLKDFAEVGKERESLYNLMSFIKNRDCGFLELQV